MSDEHEEFNPIQTQDITTQALQFVAEASNFDEFMERFESHLKPAMLMLSRDQVTLAEYVIMHDGRIEAMEGEEDSRLTPDDADMLTKYISATLTILTEMVKASPVSKDSPAKALVALGKECLDMVKEITVEGESDDEDDPDSEH